MEDLFENVEEEVKEVAGVVVPDSIAIQQEIVSPVVAKSHSIIITNDIENGIAGEFAKEIKRGIKTIKSKFKEPKSAAFDAHKKIKALENELLNPLLEASKITIEKISEYHEKQEKIRIEAQRRLDEEARIEREKLDRIAREERERIEREAREKQAELDEVARIERERLNEEARAARELGMQEEAERFERERVENERKAQIERDRIEAERMEQEAKRQAEEQVQEAMQAATVTQSIAPQAKQKGISHRDNWQAGVVDINLIPREYLLPNMQALNALARATKGAIKIAGVEFVNNSITAVKI